MSLKTSLLSNFHCFFRSPVASPPIYFDFLWIMLNEETASFPSELGIASVVAAVFDLEQRFLLLIQDFYP